MIGFTAWLALIALQTLSAQPLDVRTFGAKGDGVTDDTAAFQTALNQCGRLGGTVDVPPGRYAFNGTLDIPESVTLRGPAVSPQSPGPNGYGSFDKGTVLFVRAGKGAADGPPFITLHRNSALSGLTLFYPEQSLDIVPYPWTIRGDGDGCTILNTTLVNPFQAVDFGANPCGRHRIDGLFGQPLKTGIFVDQSQDKGEIERVQFTPMWSTDKKVWAYTSQMGTAFLLGRCESETIQNCLNTMYSIGYHFVAGKNGSGNVLLHNCTSDTGPLALKVDSVQLHSGVTFDQCQFMSGIEVGVGNSGPVKFASCAFWGIEGFTDEHAKLRGFGQTTFLGCHFVHGAQLHKDAYAIDAYSGALTVDGCEFMDLDTKTNHIRIGEGVRTAVVMANTFRSPIHILSKSQGQVALIGNVSASSGR